MISYLLLLMAVIFFVWGLIMLMKGWHGCAEDDIAPVSDWEGTKECAVIDGGSAMYPFERRIQENEKKAEQLKAENQNLMRELKEKEDQLRQLRDEEEFMQKNSDQKIHEAQKAMDFLETQLEESARTQAVESSARQEALKKQLSEITSAVNQLRQEKEDWAAVRADLQDRLHTAEAHNARLVEAEGPARQRESVLRRELARQHDQILGLEKICEDFRIQLDEMAKSSVANG